MRLSPGVSGAPGQGGPPRPLGPSDPPHSELTPRYGAPFGRLCVPMGPHPVPQMPLTGEDLPQNVHVIAVRPCVGAVACLGGCHPHAGCTENGPLPSREVVCGPSAQGRRALNRGHVGPLRGLRWVGGAWRRSARCECLGGGL